MAYAALFCGAGGVVEALEAELPLSPPAAGAGVAGAAGVLGVLEPEDEPADEPDDEVERESLT